MCDGIGWPVTDVPRGSWFTYVGSEDDGRAMIGGLIS